MRVFRPGEELQMGDGPTVGVHRGFGVELPFTDDFERADGPLGWPWVDLHTAYPVEQDPQGVRSNTACNILHRDDNYGEGTVTSGWRGGAWVETGLGDNVSVVVEQVASAPGNGVTGGPMACVNLADGSLAIGVWYNYFWDYIELGAVSTEPDGVNGFRYLDANWCEDFAGAVEMELRVVDGVAEVIVEGDRYCVADVPAGLVGSTRHGFQTDDVTGDAETATVDSVTISEDDTAITDYSSPSVSSAAYLGATTKFASASSYSVPLPASVDAGQTLYMVVVNKGNRSFTTPAGWTLVDQDGLFTVVAVYRKTAVGNEDGSTVAVGLDGAAVGASWSIALDDVSEYRPNMDVEANLALGSTSLEVPGQPNIGRHRLALMVGASNTDTTLTAPGTYTPLGATSAGGADVSLAVWGRDSSVDGTTAPYSDHPAETVTAADSGALFGSVMLVNPDPTA